MAGARRTRVRAVLVGLLVVPVLSAGLSGAAMGAAEPATEAGITAAAEAPRIAFARSAARGDDFADYEIFTVAEDGSDLRRLTRNAVEDNHPSYSPDGRHIAFTRTRSGVSQIYVMDHDGRNVRKLTSGTRGSALPDWSPDGKWIVFTRHFNAQLQSELYKVRSAGGTPIRLTNTRALEFAPEWSPDGKLIAFTISDTSRDLFGIGLIRPDGTRRRVLVNNPRASWGYSDFNPTWSTSGQRVAFAREVRGLAIDIFTVRRDGTGLQRLTRLGGEAQLPTYSADGRIAFMHDGGISVMRRDGSDIRRIVAPPPRDQPPSPASWPDWAHAVAD
jgi:Tol biopolymer transport system component